MNNLSDFANFGELQNFFGGVEGGAERKSAPRAPKTLATPLMFARRHQYRMNEILLIYVTAWWPGQK